MHEHRSGKDYSCTFEIQFKTDNCSASAMMKGRERK